MKQITEKDNEQEIWFKEAEKQTLETLPEFIRHLLEDYGHDYGTICHALASMEHWNNVKFPSRLIRYEEMLYPQYGYKFTAISKETWKWLQEEATKTLLKYHIHPSVERHLTEIANGIVPFGYKVEE